MRGKHKALHIVEKYTVLKVDSAETDVYVINRKLFLAGIKHILFLAAFFWDKK